MATPAYIVITPVRDESQHIRSTVQALESQTIPPRQWVVVDDGSTDGTGEILDECVRRIEWMTVVHRPDRGRRANGGGVMEAFYAGYATVSHVPCDYLVKLDGDLSFGPDYFERCFAMFAADPRLGIGGGTVCRLDGGQLVVDSRHDPLFHVRGATKIYRHACWSVVSPLLIAPGWDIVDEVKANLLGWTTRTFSDIVLVQHKPTGGGDGVWRNAFKNGRASYLSGYHPAFMAAKCLRRSLESPVLVRGVGLLAGYVSGYLRRVPREVDPGVIGYLRQQQLRRLLNRPSIYTGD